MILRLTIANENVRKDDRLVVRRNSPVIVTVQGRAQVPPLRPSVRGCGKRRGGCWRPVILSCGCFFGHRPPNKHYSCFFCPSENQFPESSLNSASKP